MILDPCHRSGLRLTPGALAPIRVVVSRFITTYSTPSEALASTFRLPVFTVIRHALAVRERLGHPPVGPSFRCQIRIGMSSFATPGKSAAAFVQFLHRRYCLHLVLKGSAFPTLPQICFTWVHDFEALLPFAYATTCRLVHPPVRADSAIASPSRVFTSRLPPGWSPNLGAGYRYRANWTICTDRTCTGWIRS